MKAHFVRKPCTVEDLKNIDRDKASDFVIEETVELD